MDLIICKAQLKALRIPFEETEETLEIECYFFPHLFVFQGRRPIITINKFIQAGKCPNCDFVITSFNYLIIELNKVDLTIRPCVLCKRWYAEVDLDDEVKHLYPAQKAGGHDFCVRCASFVLEDYIKLEAVRRHTYRILSDGTKWQHRELYKTLENVPELEFAMSPDRFRIVLNSKDIRGQYDEAVDDFIYKLFPKIPRSPFSENIG